MRALRYLFIPFVAILLEGCRDQYPSSPPRAIIPDPSQTAVESGRFLFTDVDDSAVVSMTVSGGRTVVLTPDSSFATPGGMPVLWSSPRRGMMVITRLTSLGDSVSLTVRNLDGSGYGRFPERTIARWRFEEWLPPILSPDGRFLADVREWDGGTADPPIFDLRVEELIPPYRVNEFPIVDGLRSIRSMPAISPDGTRIAMLRGNGLVVMGIDGADEKVLMSAEDRGERGYCVAWSPDGSRIAVSGMPAHHQVTIVDPGSSGQTVHTAESFTAIDGMSWSPDGAKVAFWGGVGTTLDIGVMEVATGACTNLTATQTTDEFMPGWSPDGRHILYVTRAIDGAFGSPTVYDLTSRSVRTYPGRTLMAFWSR